MNKPGAQRSSARPGSAVSRKRGRGGSRRTAPPPLVPTEPCALVVTTLGAALVVSSISAASGALRPADCLPLPPRWTYPRQGPSSPAIARPQAHAISILLGDDRNLSHLSSWICSGDARRDIRQKQRARSSVVSSPGESHGRCRFKRRCCNRHGNLSGAMNGAEHGGSIKGCFSSCSHPSSRGPSRGTSSA